MRRLACVTGAAGQFGQATSRRLAAQGWHVAMIDNPAALMKCGDIAHAKLLDIDLTSSADVLAIPHRLGTDYGFVRAFIHCVDVAGRAAMDAIPISETRLEDWDEALALHLESPMLISQILLQPMRDAGWGRIVLLGDQAARASFQVESTAYACAQGGLLGLARSIALEMGRCGVTANLIIPGSIRDDVGAGGFAIENVRNPDAFAAAVSFLLSDEAALINGAAIDVNGGQLML